MLDTHWSPEFVARWTACLVEHSGYCAASDVPGVAQYSRWGLVRGSWVYGPLLTYGSAQEQLPDWGQDSYISRQLVKAPDHINPGQAVTMRLAITDQNANDLWSKALHSGCRNRVKKARKSELDMKWSDEASSSAERKSLLDDAWEILGAIHRRHGTPLFERALFDGLVLASLMQVAVVYQGRQATAMLTTVSDQNIMWVPWCGALAEFHALSPNHISHWSALERAVRAKCQILDFGRSPYGGGTFEFKRKWGCQPVVLQTRRAGQIINTPVTQSKRIEFFSKAWRLLPRSVQKSAGPTLFHSLAS